MYYCHTITQSLDISIKFDVVRKTELGEFFCSSAFSSSEDCLWFAQDIECAKCKILEMDYIIVCNRKKFYFPFVEFNKLS